MKDETYGKRLLNFFDESKNYQVNFELITERGLKEKNGDKEEQAVWLTDLQDVYEDKDKSCIRICENKEEEGIYKYQKASEIYEQVMSILQVDMEKGEQGNYAVFAPGGRGAETMAAILSQDKGRKGNCVYISFSAFSVYSAWNGDDTKIHLGDLIFSDEENEFKEMERLACKELGEARILPPFCHFKDLIDCTPSELAGVLQRLRQYCGYDIVVVEFQNLQENFLDILDVFDHVILVEEKDLYGKIRKAMFYRYCEMEEKQSLISKLSSVTWSENWEKIHRKLQKHSPGSWREQNLPEWDELRNEEMECDESS